MLPSPEGITPQLIPAMRERALEVAAEIDGYRTDQFENHDMVDGYREMGEEMLAQLDGRIDAWVSYVGTAGCLLGVAGALRERCPDVRRVAVEPAESAVLSGRAAGTHRIEGGGVGFVPPLLDVARDIDDVRRGAAGRGVRDGPPGGARGGCLVGAVVRREPGRRARGGARARAGAAGRHRRRRLGTEVPRRGALPAVAGGGTYAAVRTVNVRFASAR